MSCPTPTIVSACDFPNFLVQQTPYFDELIMEDIRPTDGWLLNVDTEFLPMGTPVEVTQDRFRSVFPNTTRPWSRVTASSPGCVGNPCDPTPNQIGWGADRLTWYAEETTWETPLLCYRQNMHITHAQEHLDQIISSILRPATTAISSAFLRKRALLWSKRKNTANRNLTQFTYTWTQDADGNERYFDTSAAPDTVFHLVPQMLQNRFSPLMRIGYAGKNPFKDTAPFIELVTDMDTAWFLDKLGGSVGQGTGSPSIGANWRFTQFDAANAYWRYGFSGQIGNFMARVDELGLRFNYVTDLGEGAAPNRYRYEVVLPYVNGVTTGAGGAAGLGSDENPDFDRAQFRISFITHKKAMKLRTISPTPLHPDMPFGHQDFGGKWRFLMHDLGEDQNGVAIGNKWENKGQFGAWFEYYVQPQHYEFQEAFFHRGEQHCIPELEACNDDPQYPTQVYSSQLPQCPLPDEYDALYGVGVPTGDDAGPLSGDRDQP